MNKLRVWSGALLVAAWTAGVLGAQQQPPPQQAPPAAPAKPTSAAESLILEKIIVKVNGEILTQTELENLQIQELRDRNRQIENRKDLSNEEVRKQLLEITPSLLVEEVNGLLLIQRARELNIKFTEEAFKSSVDNIYKQNPELKNERDLNEALKSAGLTMAQLRLNFEKAYLRYMVEQREVAKNVTLTEQEARQYYTANQKNFMKPATVTLREILISVPVTNQGGAPAFQQAIAEAAEKKINDVRARAIGGEDFLKLIAEVSESGSKANNGLVGPIVVAELNPNLAAQIEKLEPGGITEPIRSRGGFQIFKLESRSAAEPEPFEKVKNEVAAKIYESRRDVEMAKFLDKLRAQALIEWKDENFRKLYEQGLAKSKSTQ